MQFGWYSTQSANCLPVDRPGFGRGRKCLSARKNPPHRGRRDSHAAQVGTAVSQFAVRAVGLTPLIEQRQDLAFLARQQPVRRRPAGRRVDSLPASAAGDPRAPPRLPRRSSPSCPKLNYIYPAGPAAVGICEQRVRIPARSSNRHQSELLRASREHSSDSTISTCLSRTWAANSANPDRPVALAR